MIEAWRRHCNDQTALGARLQAARAGGRAVAGLADSAQPTFKLDHQTGADHRYLHISQSERPVPATP
jgi:hypothetical protein